MLANQLTKDDINKKDKQQDTNTKVNTYNETEALKEYVDLIQNKLLSNLMLKARRNDPVKYKFADGVEKRVLKEWRCLGAGNYAVVFQHKKYKQFVVKIYAESQWTNTKEALEQEASVYNKLGRHESYSYLYYRGENFLVLELVKGITLYNALNKGVRINESVIEDIDYAIRYAKQKGLNPYDIHAKNIIIQPETNRKAVIVDVSDFKKEGICTKWIDFKKVYYKFYRTTLYKYPVKMPMALLYVIRKAYRIYKKQNKRRRINRASL